MALSGIESKLISGSVRHLDAKKGIRFITVGRLLPLKNIDVVLDCLALIPERYQWSYTVVGTGDIEKELISKVESLGLSERVTFTGELSREDCISTIDDHDVFVMVSAPETFGLVYLEALARGLLVIGAKGCGIDGVILNEVNGFLCEPRSSTELSEVLLRIFNEDMDAIIQAGMETVKKHIDTQCAAEYLEFIREVANEKT